MKQRLDRRPAIIIFIEMQIAMPNTFTHTPIAMYAAYLAPTMPAFTCADRPIIKSATSPGETCTALIIRDCSADSPAGYDKLGFKSPIES